MEGDGLLEDERRSCFSSYTADYEDRGWKRAVPIQSFVNHSLKLEHSPMPDMNTCLWC